MSMDQYNVVPLTMTLFQPPSEDKKKVKKKQKDPAAGKSMESDNAAPKTRELKKKKVFSKGTPGILRWDGNGNIPFPNVWTTKPDGSKQKFCATFMFQDHVCSKQGCTYFHVKNKCDLEPSILVELQKWVLNKYQVKFMAAIGCGNGQ
jgi:hypothetical protein